MKIMPHSLGVRVPSRSQTRGFTLIELLTVIAIIGILAAIIIPTVGKVRATARKAQCVSNLRQWGSAVRLFANDNKGMIAIYNKSGTGPNGDGSDDQLLYSQYFGQKYMIDADGQKTMSQIVMARCPVSAASKLTISDAGAHSRDYIFVKPIGTTKKILGSSVGLPAESGIDAYNLSEAANPSRLILMAEARTPTNDHTTITDGSTFSDYVQAVQINTNQAFVFHGGLANMLYLDGHVNSLSASATLFANPANKLTINSWLTLK